MSYGTTYNKQALKRFQKPQCQKACSLGRGTTERLYNRCGVRPCEKLGHLENALEGDIGTLSPLSFLSVFIQGLIILPKVASNFWVQAIIPGSLNGCNYRNMMSPSLASLFCSHSMKKTRLFSYKSRLHALRHQQPPQLLASSLLSWLLGLGYFPIWFPLPKLLNRALTPDTSQEAIQTVHSSAYQRIYLHL